MKKIILLSVTIYLSLNGSLFAQNGTAGAQELLLPVGARSFALNGAFIAGIDGIEAMYYNPAGLSRNSGEIDVMVSYMSYIADIGLSYAAVCSNLGEIGTFGISLKSIDIGDIEITTTQDPYGTGEFFSPTLLTATLGYSRSLTDILYIGMNTNIIYEKILQTSASGVSFDLGVQAKGLFFDEGISIGAVIKNLGPEMKFEGNDLNRVAQSGGNENQIYKIEAEPFTLPLQIELGLSYRNTVLNNYNFTASAALVNSSYVEDKIKFAGEFNYDNLFFVRGGYYFSIQSTDKYRNIFGPSFGVGFNLKTLFDVSVDYAYGVSRLFNANQMFTVKLGF